MDTRPADEASNGGKEPLASTEQAAVSTRADVTAGSEHAATYAHNPDYTDPQMLAQGWHALSQRAMLTTWTHKGQEASIPEFKDRFDRAPGWMLTTPFGVE